MIAVLGGQHDSEEMRSGAAPRDRMRRRRRLGDALAIAAGHCLADMLDDLPAPRLALQRLGDDLAQLAQARAAALAADAGCRIHHALARQMVGQGPARRLACIDRTTRGRSRGGDLRLRFDLGLRLLEIGNGEFELLDELPAALGGLAELGAARLGQLNSHHCLLKHLRITTANLLKRRPSILLSKGG